MSIRERVKEENNKESDFMFKEHTGYFLNRGWNQDEDLQLLLIHEGDPEKTLRGWAERFRERTNIFERLADLFDKKELNISRISLDIYAFSGDSESLEQAFSEGLLSRQINAKR